MIRYFNCKMFLCIDALVSGIAESKIRESCMLLDCN